jgi:hypothetical protein
MQIAQPVHITLYTSVSYCTTNHMRTVQIVEEEMSIAKHSGRRALVVRRCLGGQ